MRRKLSFLLMSILFLSLPSIAQTVVKGVIIDESTKETLIGVTVFSESEKVGTATELDGSFSLKLKSAKGKLKLSYVGYKTMEIDANASMGTIALQTDAIGLSDVVVTSSVAIRRKTPVALSVIEPEMLEAKMSSQEFPEILKSTPGVYATKQGGGYGDSRINLRGFSTENIAIMINGVPMNDMEWGGVYWSNYAGLGDVTRSMQVQRGLGAAKVAAPSVGGSINIVTKSTDSEKGGGVSYMMGNDGYNKVAFNVSTGLSKDGWAMSALGSKTWGDGYIMGTDFEAYTWFVNVSKIINDKHQLSFTAFGAPQVHNQRNRNDMMRITEWNSVNADGMDKYKFNPTYGYDENGQPFSANRNSYHKPQISLNHYWTLNEKSSISTALYVSIGNGGGRRFRGTNANNLYGVSNQDGKMNNQVRLIDGSDADLRQPNTLYRDYGVIQRNNRASDNGSVDIISESINNHQWYGMLSTYNTKFGDNIDFYGGLDLRYYEGEHREKIKDLMGGSFYQDMEYRKAHKEFTGQQLQDYMEKKLYPGDDVYRNNTGYVIQTGVFGQAEYNKDALSTFIAGSISNSRYWKRDRYYYDNAKSDAKNFLGFTAKGGANYNIDENHNVFFNTGYISRAPYMRSYFARLDQSNAINQDAVNEKSYSFEVGYGFRSRIFSANLNIYHTKWIDKTMVKAFDDVSFLNMKGVDARHQGIEVDFKLQPTKQLEISGMVSLGDWIWDSKSTAKLYNAQGDQLNNTGNPIFPNGTSGMTEAEIQEISDKNIAQIDLKDVRVGNSAQTTFNLAARYKLFDNNLTVGADYNFQARNYADYSTAIPNIGGNVDKYTTPWRMPSAGTFDLNANYKFDIAGLKATIFGNINNVFDKEYLTDAKDFAAKSGGGSWDTVAVFYGFGRTYTISMKVKF